MSVHVALTKGELYCAFQPIVDVRNGTIFGYESLARSRAPQFANPIALFEAAGRSSYIGRLGRALREMSVRNCAAYPLFLNVHPDEFDEGWLVRPDDPLTGHEPGVFLEITESVPLSHYRHCHSVLREIRGRGAQVAVDDLGAGFSNLKYIADLHPEIVKLDRGLVEGLRHESRAQKLVRAIVRLCEDMGARVVAEGIETVDELNAVIDTGVHFVQGYLIARPNAQLLPVDWAAVRRPKESGQG